MLLAHQLRTKGYKQYQIAEMLGVTDRTVRNYLKQPASPHKAKGQPSKLNPYKPYIRSILEDDPYYNCVVLFDNLKSQGYTGRISILRDYVAGIRKKLTTEAVIRFETEPGRQAQVDWKEFRRTRPDGRKEKVYAFTMIMGYSRKPFVIFTRSMKQSVLLYCHIAAFLHFGVIPREILYDNMKTAFICDAEGVWRPNKRLLAFANHYGFVLRRCRVRRPQTKGKVERAIGYLAINFWPRVKKHVWEIDELNEAVQSWCRRICEKELRDFRETRTQRFEREQDFCLPLPATHYDYRDIHELRVSRESRISFETNRYSVPPEYIGERLRVKVDHVKNTAEIFAGGKSIRTIVLAAKGSRELIETPEDKAALQELWLKQQARRLKHERKRTTREEPQVDVRSPASYDKYTGSEEVA